MTLTEIAKMTEDDARDYLEKLRWPNGPVCPHCESQDVTRLHGEKHRAGTIQCNGCREQFTVTVGGVMESTHVPLVKWVLAFHLLCSSKKGMSALQLQRELNLGSYRTAWFMAHRIRHAMEGQPMQEQLKGYVEADETYVGGKPRFKGQSKRGRGTTKAPVMVLVERDGNSVCKPLQRVSSKELGGEIKKAVSENAMLITDELPVYVGIGRHFEGGHEVVKHGQKQYVRKTQGGLSINTNTAESFNALIKRGHYGIYHSMSKKHLHRYCSEFSFRWNHRKTNDSVRTEAALRQAEGKRLTYA
jgi:transposase-like protein